MKYFEVTFTTTPCNETINDVVSALAGEIGFESFVEWENGVQAYVQQTLFDEEALKDMVANFPLPDTQISYEIKEAEDKDWNEEWEKNFFQPIVIGDRCCIHSTFHKDTPQTEYEILINPQMAFGTGHHETTSSIICELLDAVVAAGIEEIIIVRGYLGEQFDQLLYKYPNIKFVENPFYNEANNISSALLVRDLLQNAYVLEADLVLSNPALITKYQYTSNYLGVPTDLTDDWCFETKNRVITKVKVGGNNCHHMFGISYWTEEAGAKLCDDIKKVYEMPGGKERYWDQVPLEYCLRNYTVEVRECTFNDIVEIDSFADLKKIDPAYR